MSTTRKEKVKKVDATKRGKQREEERDSRKAVPLSLDELKDVCGGLVCNAQVE